MHYNTNWKKGLMKKEFYRCIYRRHTRKKIPLNGFFLDV